MKKNTMIKKKSNKRFSASEFDVKFDNGDSDILDHFDLENPIKRVLVDFPKWMLDHLDREAQHLGLSRQAIIKTWLNDRINSSKKI